LFRDGTSVSTVPRQPASPIAASGKIFLILLGAPALIYVLAIAVWPLAQGIAYSFYDYSLLRPGRTTFVGLGQYTGRCGATPRRAFGRHHGDLHRLCRRVEFLLGLGLALLLWRDGHFQRCAWRPCCFDPGDGDSDRVGLSFRACSAPITACSASLLRLGPFSGPADFSRSRDRPADADRVGRLAMDAFMR